MLIQNLGVFSAYAEVFPRSRRSSCREVVFSAYAEVFQLACPVSDKFFVFSAYAEVFLEAEIVVTNAGSFLRVRGGVSIPILQKAAESQFSPRTRRCFHSALGSK